ncbi:MAG: hypothetical protein HZC55_01040 [Verrucomicrobia bacterium]|nr:hypothetical protein [Verrucomicrobiota bacterium]
MTKKPQETTSKVASKKEKAGIEIKDLSPKSDASIKGGAVLVLGCAHCPAPLQRK